MSISLYHADCLDIMNDLVRKNISVDAVITDPPYNISKNNNFSTMGRSGIDFGSWDKGADLFSYLNLAFKLLNKNGCLIVFNDWKNLGDIAKYAENIGFVCKDMIRLEKTNPMPRNINRRYVTDYECAIWFTMPNAKWIFNKQAESYERPKYVGNIEKGFHPTQKNLGLMEWLIKIHTNEKHLVLDPFMGSGTTGVACKNLNRQFIGIEKEFEYYKVAKERILTEGNTEQQTEDWFDSFLEN